MNSKILAALLCGCAVTVSAMAETLSWTIKSPCANPQWTVRSVGHDARRRGTLREPR